jgi:hypothetical protein
MKIAANLRDVGGFEARSIATPIVAILLLVASVALQGTPATLSDADKYGVIHRPSTGCPTGFFEVSDVFQLRNRKSPGCVNIQHPLRPLDYLMPGEEWAPVFWGPWGWTKSVWFYHDHV